MLKLIIVCITIIIVVRILFKKEKVEDIHKGKIMYDKKAIVDEREKERIEAKKKERREHTCPKCNKYNPQNFDYNETYKGIRDCSPDYNCYECRECGATWKIYKKDPNPWL